LSSRSAMKLPNLAACTPLAARIMERTLPHAAATAGVEHGIANPVRPISHRS
jgi:hypothetical protein